MCIPTICRLSGQRGDRAASRVVGHFRMFRRTSRCASSSPTLGGGPASIFDPTRASGIRAMPTGSRRPAPYRRHPPSASASPGLRLGRCRIPVHRRMAHSCMDPAGCRCGRAWRRRIPNRGRPNPPTTGRRPRDRRRTSDGEALVQNLKGAAWRLGIFLAVCLLGAFVLVTVFAQFRFEKGKTYVAEFSNVSGLKDDDIVRIAGVEVGKVQKITVNRDATVRVEFSADDSVVLTDGSRAVIRYDDLIGNRFLAVEEGAGGIKTLKPGDTIPVDRTEPALDLDALIGGFRPLFRALNPDQVNELTGQLIEAFQGQGPTIGSFLNQAAAVTNTLADRDLLIGQVIDNLNVVLGSLGGESERFDKAVTSLSELVHGLAERRTDLSNSVAYINAGAGSFADLFSDVREPFQKVVHELDRAGGIVVADHDYFDNFLNTLPDKYRELNRQAMYGDFFSFYLCDLVLKLNGKGGQPVYVKVAGQSTGRCAPK